MRKIALLVAVCAGVIFIRPANSQTNGGQTLKKVAEFDLPGPGGKRFDYLTIDSDDHYLLSAHLAAGQTYVIDIRTNKVVAAVRDTPGAEGIEYVPALRRQALYPAELRAHYVDSKIIVPSTHSIFGQLLSAPMVDAHSRRCCEPRQKSKEFSTVSRSPWSYPLYMHIYVEALCVRAPSRREPVFAGQ
jgi:hypothetical protein